MNEPTFPKAEFGTYNVAEWMRVLSDFPPAHCMREVQHAKPAVQAVWLARTPDRNDLFGYGLQWHLAGWKPAEWWRLAMSLTVIDAIDTQAVKQGRLIADVSDQYPRELRFKVWPHEWQQWRELAEQHGALRATLAMLLTDNATTADGARNSAFSADSAGLFWAKRDVPTTKMGHRKPGDPIEYV